MGKKTIYLSKEYEVKLETVQRVTGKTIMQLMKEAIDYLYEKYIPSKPTP